MSLAEISTRRVHKHRAMRRAGLCRYIVYLPQNLLADRLVATGELSPLDRDDSALAGVALQSVLEDWITQ